MATKIFSEFPYVIAGATGSIGSAIARRLAAQGASTYLIGRNAAELQALTSQIPGSKCAVVDFQQPASIAAAFSALSSEHAQLGGFVYAVGNIPLKSFAATKPDEFADALQLNTLGAIQSLHPIARALQQGRGSVVLFSSVAAARGFANHSAISSAKAALEGLTRSLAAEWSPNVRVNAIAPSLTQSKIAKRFFDDTKMKEKLAEGHPMRRLGAPDDVAAVAEFLLSNQASWITGQVIAVDGGKSSIIK